jgi:hypothetical protein
MNLLCLSDFNQGDITAKAGELCYFAPIVAHRLLDSWPACWALAPIIIEVETVTDAIDGPPVDKMIHAPARAKGKRRG